MRVSWPVSSADKSAFSTRSVASCEPLRALVFGLDEPSLLATPVSVGLRSPRIRFGLAVFVVRVVRIFLVAFRKAVTPSNQAMLIPAPAADQFAAHESHLPCRDLALHEPICRIPCFHNGLRRFKRLGNAVVQVMYVEFWHHPTARLLRQVDKGLSGNTDSGCRAMAWAVAISRLSILWSESLEKSGRRSIFARGNRPIASLAALCRRISPGGDRNLG